MTPLSKLLGTWQAPPDLPAWLALGLALVLPVAALRMRAMPRMARPRFLVVVALAAAFASLGYIAHYLRGGPRIIDATTYFLEGRALSHGHFTWTVPEPTASFRGRFLVFSEPDRLGGIFPPGYPLLLAAGFLVGAPMVIGPLLAAALAVATYYLARELAWDNGKTTENVARFAAMLSLFCAALRYHTADTMSHGAAALGVTVALTCALRGSRTRQALPFIVAGLAVGWVLSTRLVSAIPIGAVTLFLAARSQTRARALFLVALGLLPGALLLLASEAAVTGEALRSTQRAYYATSDGPPGCFRYGFGAGIGCLYEHGDFVRDRLEGGFFATAAIGTTLRRLRMHLTDVANLEPLALLVLLPLRRRSGLGGPALVSLSVVGLHVLAYAPFYFDGNYPGGGARMYADVLPIEHAILALSAFALAPAIAFETKGAFLLSLSSLGFAVHASHDHVALANREGGRPMFEPDLLREAGVTSGLLFVDTDHGFDLAHDPGADASHGIVAARLRGDDHDRLVYDLLGHPTSHLYKAGDGAPSVVHFIPLATSPISDRWTFEAESDWPPIAQSGGCAIPVWTSGACPSHSRVLALTPAGPRATVTIELPVPRDGRWTLTPRVFRRGGVGTGTLEVLGTTARWEWSDAGTPSCEELAPTTLALKAPSARLVIEARAGEVSLDNTSVVIARP